MTKAKINRYEAQVLVVLFERMLGWSPSNLNLSKNEILAEGFDNLSDRLGSVVGRIFKSFELTIKSQAQANGAIEKLRKIPEKEIRMVRKQWQTEMRTLVGNEARLGRKEKLTVAQKKDFCGIVGTYIANGHILKDALQLAAVQHKVSFRTGRRVWENRPY